MQNYRLVERGKVVLYTTSVMVIRETHERCLALKKILENHMIEFEERDVFLCRDFQRELMERLGQEHFDLPQIFVSGFNLGVSKIHSPSVLFRVAQWDLSCACEKRCVPSVHSFALWSCCVV